MDRRQRAQYHSDLDMFRAALGRETAGDADPRIIARIEKALEQNVTAALRVIASEWAVSLETVRTAFVPYRDSADDRALLKRAGAAVEYEFTVYPAYTEIVIDQVVGHITGRYKSHLDMDPKGKPYTQSRVSATVMQARIDKVVRAGVTAGEQVALPSPTRQHAITKSVMRKYGLLGTQPMKYVLSGLGRPPGGRRSARQLMPGEQVEVDSTRLDLRLCDPRTGEVTQGAELLAMVDRATRSLLAVLFVVGHATAAHVAILFFMALNPKTSPRAVLRNERWDNRFFTHEDVERWAGQTYRDESGHSTLYGLPFLRIQEVISDHGMIFKNGSVEHLLHSLKISLSLARVGSPWDKPIVERFFAYLKVGLLAYMKGFTGGSVQDRGGNLPAVVTAAEVNEVLLAFGAAIHQRHVVRGLKMPGVKQDLTPNQALAVAAASGGLVLPDYDPLLPFQVLEVKRAAIGTAGIVNVGTYKYCSPETKERVGVEPPHSKGWDFYINPNDRRHIWLVDPATGTPIPVDNVHFGDAPRPVTDRLYKAAQTMSREKGLTGNAMRDATVEMLLDHGIAVDGSVSVHQQALDEHRSQTTDHGRERPAAPPVLDDTEDPEGDDLYDAPDLDDETYFDDEAGIA
jgi:hypothetical protein